MKIVDPFYVSKEWRDLRIKIIRRDNWACQICGTSIRGKKHGGQSPHVDHIIPRRERPDLQLEPSNLRALCQPCHNRHTRMGQLAKDKPEIGADGYPVAV